MSTRSFVTPTSDGSGYDDGAIRSRTEPPRAASSAAVRLNSSVRELKREKSSLPVLGLGDNASKGGPKKKKLGMFKGVLVPTCENMWGVIIFLRFYTIVGYAGLGYTILIVTLSFMVALLTALALSAIATCGTSHSLAGVYPMLARALGREVATATGLIYFVGIVCLAVLECLGACEELFQVAPMLVDIGGARLWGFIFLSGLSAFVAGGIKIISYLGLVFFAVVIITLFFLYISLVGAPGLIAVDAPSPGDVITGAAHRMLADNLTLTAHRILAGAADGSASGSMAAASSSASGSGGHGLIFPSGLSITNFENNWGSAFTEDTSSGGPYLFSNCLSIFFPCFTGILSGANRASSLRDPTTAIPNGTLGAICFSYFMYLTLFILWAGVGDRLFLTMAHGQINALFYPTVMGAQIGIILSSLGQALQCLVVAPRLLASIAASETIRVMKPLAKLTAGEPKRALLVTYFIGSCIAMLGSLNLVAPLLSMCFLLCYACMNLNSAFLDFLKDPHWRPKWRWFHWSVGLAGFVLCFVMMFVIQWIYALVAWGMCFLLLAYIFRSNINLDYGSAVTGLRFHVAIRSLLSIDMSAHLSNNWKPQLLVLYSLREVEQHEIVAAADISPAAAGIDQASSAADTPSDLAHGSNSTGAGAISVADSPGNGDTKPVQPDPGAGHTHEHMFAVAHQLRHGSGLIIAAAIMQMGEHQANHDLAPVIAAEQEERQMQVLMKEMGVQGFAMTVMTHDATEGKAYAIQCAGLGPLTPNTVLMGWPWWWQSNPEKYVPEFLSTIHQATLRQKALLVCHDIKDFPTNDEPQFGYIDVWWIKHDGGLLLLISHLLQKHRVWRNCRLRLHLITEIGTDTEQLKTRVHKLLNKINISAHVEEVIQIDTASLLPYMMASQQRERNEAMAEESLRAQGEDHLADIHTAESLLAQPSPRLESSGHRGELLENPLTSYGAAKTEDGSMDAAAGHTQDTAPSAADRSVKAKKGRLTMRRASASAIQRPHGDDYSSDEHQRDRSNSTMRASLAPSSAADFAPDLLNPSCGELSRKSMRRPSMSDATTPAARRSHEGLGSSVDARRVGISFDDSVVPSRGGGSIMPPSAAPSMPRAASATEVSRQLSGVPIDTTGDGVPDAFAVDTVGDGKLDTIIPAPNLRVATPPPSPPGEDQPKAKTGTSPPGPASRGSPPGHPSSPSSKNDGTPGKEQRWSLIGASKNWGSKSSLPQVSLPPAAISSSSKGDERSSNTGSDDMEDSDKGKKACNSPASGHDKARRMSGSGFLNLRGASSSTKEPTSPSAKATEGGDGSSVATSRTSTSRMANLLSKGGSSSRFSEGGGSSGNTPSVEPLGPDPVEAATRMLRQFSEKHGLSLEAEEELESLFTQSVKKVDTASAGPTYRWDQIHEMIVSHSPGTALVIVNLPDPPELEAGLSQEEQMRELLEYMNYMEGVALNLPRVLYVHGSGQEVINFDKME